MLFRRTFMKLFSAKRTLPLVLFVVLISASSVWGQNGDQSSAPAPAATGPAERNVENPPLTGLDKPVSEPTFGGRSYLVPGLQFSQSIEGYSGSGGDIYAVTRALGSVDMVKNWKTSQFGLDYIAGGSFYEGSHLFGDAYQMHTLAASQRFFWRSGQLAIRDSFDYLPEGTFGYGSFGGVGSFDSSGGLSGVGPGSGIGSGLSGGIPVSYGGGGYGSYGLQPHINNTAVVDITQAFSARSSVTMAGAYSIGHYLDQSSSPFPLFNNEQVTGQVGYNRLLNARDQIGFNYSFQQFHYPQQEGVGSVEVHTWNVLYGHRITGKLNFVVSGGPEIVTIHTPEFPVQLLPGIILIFPANTTTNVSGSGSVTLGYTVSSRTNVSGSYMHYTSAGSGYYPGAQTNAFSTSVSHLFARQWTTSTSGGYSRNSNLQQNSPIAAANASSYNYWYAGTSIRRQIGRHFNAFVAYQYDSFGFASCAVGASCGSESRQHSGVVGIEWHPNPLRF